jgi:hypothetical protein
MSKEVQVKTTMEDFEAFEKACLTDSLDLLKECDLKRIATKRRESKLKWSLLKVAAYFGACNIVAELIKLGHPLEKRTPKRRETVIFDAIRLRQPVLLDTLLRHGANVNVSNFQGDTPLHVAIFVNDISMIKAILLAGANIHIKNNRGISPIVYATMSSHVKPEILRFLLLWENPKMRNIAKKVYF